MGRKIPGKKHRKVKDPTKQRNQRLAELKNKINNPPKKEDDQEIPKSVIQIMKLKEKAKQLSKQKPRRKQRRGGPGKKDRFDVERALGRESMLPGMDRPDRFLPPLQQQQHEPIARFAKRINSMCNEVLNEVRFEEKFGVEVKRDSEGHITRLERIKSTKRSRKPKLSEKRKLRAEAQLNKVEPVKDFKKCETFLFGDIVHQPPTHLTLPTKASVARPKPGQRDLLLKQKREEQRKLVVEAFRNSKKSKKSSGSHNKRLF